MFKALTPILALLVAIALFLTYVRPTFDDIKVVQDETYEYAEAIDTAGQLRARIDELRAERNNISVSNLERLEALLPDAIDEVRLLIDLDALASSHGLVLDNISVETSETPGAPNPERTPPLEDLSGAGISADGTMMPETRDFYSGLDVSFTVSGAYDQFRDFLIDVERTLILMEVMEIDFVAPSVGQYTDYTVTLRVFELNPL